MGTRSFRARKSRDRAALARPPRRAIDFDGDRRSSNAGISVLLKDKAYVGEDRIASHLPIWLKFGLLALDNIF